MLGELLNFKGINWWTLLGGLAFNFFITLMVALAGTFMSISESTAEIYANIGPVLTVAALFILCGLAGYIVVKLADQVPFKHAFLSSLGALIPLIATGVISMNFMAIMMAAVAVAGNVNGAGIALRQQHKNRHYIEDDDEF